MNSSISNIDITRRAFLGGSASAVALFGQTEAVWAAGECVPNPPRLAAYVPNRLSVDCASRQNFRLFRQNEAHLGLAGVISVNQVKGKFGTYSAGKLFLFPWIKRRVANKVWAAAIPTSATGSQSASPIPNGNIGPDEYFCNFVLQAPSHLFIGVVIDVPFDPDRARMAQFTNVDSLADKQAIGISWTSSNLNAPYFEGSRMIPAGKQCNGKAWRDVIVDGLQQAASRVC